MDFNVGPFDLEDETPNAMQYMYHQEYASKRNSSNDGTLSNELLDDENQSSFRTENSRLSFDEIDQEFSRAAEDFEKPPADLNFDPKRMIEGRYGENEVKVIQSENYEYKENDPASLTSQTIKSTKSRKSRSRSNKRIKQLSNVDIEDQIKKRKEKLTRIKQNVKYAPKASTNHEIRLNDPERRHKKLANRNKALKEENLKLHKQNKLLNCENKKLLDEIRIMKTEMNRILSSKAPTCRNNEYSTLTGGHPSVRSSSLTKNKASGSTTVKNNNHKKSKPKNKPKDSVQITKNDFEQILDSLTSFQNRLKIPNELMENNEALQVENSILRQALEIYEDQIPKMYKEHLNNLLGDLKPNFTPREIKMISMSNYWRDKTNHLIKKYTKVIKAFRSAFTKETQNNLDTLTQIKSLQNLR
ncbi:unnamed protein product [Moneuplotes crassus]|uniref:Uncharacterized protein n=1 Tax=Euplotes crassus TaxID=5936 RepID=A0AAD1UNJ2_EUPCR|nr:unnamed protein product [Moneuplotes crassus]